MLATQSSAARKIISHSRGWKASTRARLPIAKSTLCTWHEQLAALAQGLIDR
jgi:hypothetical protein